MIIDTEKLDVRALAIALMKRGGQDWIDTPAETLWADKNEGARAGMVEWREGLIAAKVDELQRLFVSMEAVHSE